MDYTKEQKKSIWFHVKRVAVMVVVWGALISAACFLIGVISGVFWTLFKWGFNIFG